MVFSSGRFYSISLFTPIRINLQMGLRSWRNHGAVWVGGGGRGGGGGRREAGERGLTR